MSRRIPSFTDDEMEAIRKALRWVGEYSLRFDWQVPNNVIRWVLGDPSPAPCNCGFGGFHDDTNPRCRANTPSPAPCETCHGVKFIAWGDNNRQPCPSCGGEK